MMPKTPLHDSRMIFVVADPGSDANVQISREIATCNYLMTACPGNVYLCRGAFIQYELAQQRHVSVWGDFYVALVSRCDAVYCVDGYRNHPLADYALENEIPLLDDHMDLEIFLSTPMAEVQGDD